MNCVLFLCFGYGFYMHFVSLVFWFFVSFFSVFIIFVLELNLTYINMVGRTRRANRGRRAVAVAGSSMIALRRNYVRAVDDNNATGQNCFVPDVPVVRVAFRPRIPRVGADVMSLHDALARFRELSIPEHIANRTTKDLMSERNFLWNVLHYHGICEMNTTYPRGNFRYGAYTRVAERLELPAGHQLSTKYQRFFRNPLDIFGHQRGKRCAPIWTDKDKSLLRIMFSHILLPNGHTVAQFFGQHYLETPHVPHNIYPALYELYKKFARRAGDCDPPEPEL